MPKALKGRHKGDGLVAPFQGSIAGAPPSPRALPWADLWLPLRGVGKKCATSKRASEASRSNPLARASGWYGPVEKPVLATCLCRKRIRATNRLRMSEENRKSWLDANSSGSF